ncbi:MAG: energy transducer TonB [Bacteroidota bacterium]
MKPFIIFLFLLPHFVFAQKHFKQKSVQLGLLPDKQNYIGYVTVDSLTLISNVERSAEFTVNFDTLAKKLQYPQMEKDNDIEGNLYAMFRVSSNGKTDSVWLSNNVSPGIDKMVLRFLNSLPNVNPARIGYERVESIYRLSFHFSVEELPK